MKPPEIESRLWHIAAACEKVIRITAGKTIEEYASDDLLPDAVERQLTIVGEAVARIAEVDRPTAQNSASTPGSWRSGTSSCTTTRTSITPRSGASSSGRCRFCWNASATFSLPVAHPLHNRA